jgi:hypothetical protein
LKDLPADKEKAIPWFGQNGHGIQYELPMSIDDLISDGYLKPVTSKFDVNDL